MKNLNKKTGSRSLCSVFLLKFFLYIMPICLFLSYHPVISIGGNETMNFELSVAEIWLVLFDIVGFFVLCQKKRLFSEFKSIILWLLFPVWLSLSVIWSLNTTRGLLTAGLMWALVFAGYTMWSLRDMFDYTFFKKWMKWFLSSSILVCFWCVLQCILDLAGVGREYTLMCAGCTYHMFGFPHPNGFAIEPQFMGNLLLAPAMVCAWLLMNKQVYKNLERERSRDSHFHNRSGGLGPVLQYRIRVRDCCKNDNGSRSLCSKFLYACLFMIAITLFLTFSRGAIYAFVVGMLFMSGFLVAKAVKKRRGEICKRVGVVWGLIVGAFFVALCGQGLMAELSPTYDTFGDGVSKVVNHLSLGVIKTRTENTDDDSAVEKSVENSANKAVESFDENSKKEKSVFDGYVAESTDARVRLTDSAFSIWKQNYKTAIIGVGLGGAGQALYNNGLSPAPKEIIQNEYASLLVETGVVGVMLLILTLGLTIRLFFLAKASDGLLFGLMLAYGVSLFFFSGLPNALHIFFTLIGLFVFLYSDNH